MKIEQSNNRTIEQSNNRTIGHNWLWAVGLTAALAGCSTAQLDKFNKDLADFNTAIGVPTTVPVGGNSTSSAANARLATPAADNGKSTQLIVPADKTVSQAVDAALPLIKKVLATHACINSQSGLLLLNQYAPPGRVPSESRSASWPGQHMDNGFGVRLWKYHDTNQCPRIQAIDRFVMPAFNALQFRTVYFADDSGEADQFTFELRRSNLGEWQLWSYIRSN